MRSLVWLGLGLVGFGLAYSTRADQTYSTLRLVGCVLLAIGSIGLLPRSPAERAAEPTPDAHPAAQRASGVSPQPFPNQVAASSSSAAPERSMT